MPDPFTKEEPLTIAVSKGRVAKAFALMLTEAGYDCTHHGSRTLLAEDRSGAVRLIYAKGTDVSTYVERGVAGLGIVGSDLLMEQQPCVYELAELPIGRCKVCIAGPKPETGVASWPEKAGRHITRLATKYPELARQYLQNKGVLGEIIYLNGSVELGPLLGLSDAILDIVETGKTLEENNLVVLEEVMDVSARLVANRSYYKTRYTLCKTLIEQLERVSSLKEAEYEKA